MILQPMKQHRKNLNIAIIELEQTIGVKLNTVLTESN